MRVGEVKSSNGPITQQEVIAMALRKKFQSVNHSLPGEFLMLEWMCNKLL